MKLIRDGKVGVVIHPDFGSGFYDPQGRSRTDATVVQAVLDTEGQEAPEGGQFATDERMGQFWPWGHIVVWVTEGAKYRIHEYDGSESLVLEADQHWEVA